MDKTIALIGCGKAGLSVALALKREGWLVVGCASRGSESEKRGSEWLNCRILGSFSEIPTGAIVVLGVPEAALKTVDAKLAMEDTHLKDRVVVHLSGGLPARVLEECRLSGASVGSMHPIMALPDPLTGAIRLKKATFALEGRFKAVSAMQAMAHSMSGTYFILSTRGKTLYHAAAVVASNHLVALLADSEEMLKLAGGDMKVGWPAFQSLVEGTVANFYAAGSVASLTGPVERGDLEMVKTHLQSLKRWPHLMERYRIMALATVDIAKKRHPERSDELQALAKLLIEWQSRKRKG